MKQFDILFKRLIEHEGYYANVKGDKGGETYMGIARKIHPKWHGWKMIDAHKKIYGEPKHNEQLHIGIDPLVKVFYHEKYYLKNGIDLINDFSLKYIVLDWCVNSGGLGAAKVQMIVEAEPDGIIGKNTAKAINSFNPSLLFDTIKLARIKFYHDISLYGQNAQFLNGWLTRINSFKYEKTN